MNASLETYTFAIVDEQVTRDCLDTAIAICGPGVDFREIGAVIT